MVAGIIPVVAQAVFPIIDKLFTSEKERNEAKLKLMELEQQGQLSQIELNTKEAEHSSVFVAGWRPFIGWVCGIAFLWAFLLRPMMSFFVVVSGYPELVNQLPELQLGMMMPVLTGMLGLGAMRSWEKDRGVNRSRITGINRNADKG